MGAILDMAKIDAKRIVTMGGFNQDLIITPTGLPSLTVQGLATRHSQGFDTNGLPVIATNVHCTIVESDLTDAELTTRNAKGELIIKGWVVSFTDAIRSYDYRITEAYPDNSLGVIRCTLTHYE